MSLNLKSNINNSTKNYSLEYIQSIIFDGFNYIVPEHTMKIITELANQVGSPDYIKTPVFQKRLHTDENNKPEEHKERSKKKKTNKFNEINDDSEWDKINKFTVSKINNKIGIDADFDIIRTFINKMTDKNMDETKNKIIEIINNVTANYSHNELNTFSKNIFDLLTSNKYYSKNYANLYSCLLKQFECIYKVYIENFKSFIHVFDNIQYVDPNVNYDKYCEINKINEKRQALTQFYYNLMVYNVISKKDIIKIIKFLLNKIYNFISLENKTHEVDELTENFIILYNKDLCDNNLDSVDSDDSDSDSDSDDSDDSDIELISNMTINETVEKIANSKVKDYKSLTNKSLFKFMDMLDM